MQIGYGRRGGKTGAWMEGLVSANSIFHVEWQWMNQVTLALLLTRGTIESDR